MFELNKTFIDWLFGLNRWKKLLLQIMFDGLIAPTMFLLAFFMRLETTDYLFQLDTYIGVFITTVTTLVVFAALGLYNNLTRHVSNETAYSIVIGSAVSCAVLLSSIILFELQIPRSVPLIYAILLSAFATAMRFLIRFLGQGITQEKRENVAIYNADVAGIQVMEALRKNPNYNVRLFIDDNQELSGKNLSGIPICNLDHTKTKFKQLEIHTLLFFFFCDIEVMRQRVFEILEDYPLKIKKIPSISSLLSSKFEIEGLKNIKIEDLLGREPVRHNPALMAKTISKKDRQQ